LESTVLMDKESETKRFLYNLFDEINEKAEDSIDEFLAQQLVKHGVAEDISKAKAILKDIDDVIESINENHNELKRAKATGKSRVQWLETKLEELIKSTDSLHLNELIKELQEGVSSSNYSMIYELFNDYIQTSTTNNELVFDDMNKKAIIKNLVDHIQQNTLLASIFFDAEQKQNEKSDLNTKENRVLQSYFDSNIDDPRDKVVKKVMTTGLLITTKKGWTPFLKDKSHEEITYMVDRGLTIAKIGHKMAKGELNLIDAVDYMIDRTAAKLVSYVERTCVKAGGAIGSKLGAFVGTLFGPTGAAVGTTVGRIAGELAGQKIGQSVSKGIEKIATKAKEWTRKIGKTVANGVKNFSSGLKSGIKSIFS
jgi:hypothetical protein